MTGSLQIKNGKYYAVINVKNNNGVRKQRWISSGISAKGNKKKAEQFLRDTIRQYEIEELIISTDTSFCNYVKIWLKSIEKSIDPITYQGYESVALAHIIPYFEKKNTLLNKISREDIQRYINEKYEHGRLDGKGGLSPKTLKTHKLIIRLALKEAVKSHLITTNPCDDVILPKMARREISFYSASQLNDLFNAIKNEPLYPLIYFTAIYGLRRSEVLGLKWDSVNFENNTITIKHTVVRFNDVFEKDSTKTSSSYRSYPLTEEVKNILTMLKEAEKKNITLFGKEYIKNGYIFKWDNGKPYAPDYITSKFSKILKNTDSLTSDFTICDILVQVCLYLKVSPSRMFKNGSGIPISVSRQIFMHTSIRKEKQISQSRCQTHFIFSFRISVRKSVRNAIEN